LPIRLVSVALPLLLLLGACGPVSFDPQVWRAEAGNMDGESRRLAMAGELRRKQLTPGKPREEVLALLGEPDIRRDDRDIYFLGRGALAPDFESLEILYDPSGRVSSTRLAQS